MKFFDGNDENYAKIGELKGKECKIDIGESLYYPILDYKVSSSLTVET